MQVRNYATLRRRILGNWATLYAGQLSRGDKHGDHLQVISIWLVGSGFLPPSKWIETWTVSGEQTGQTLHDDLLIVTFDLGRWASLREGPEGGIIGSKIDSWLYLLTESERIDPDSLPAVIAEREYEEAIEIMSVFTTDDVERDRHFNRLEYQRMLKDIEHDFREEGLKVGRTEGRAEGAHERAFADARNFKRLGVSVEIIAEATGLSIETVAGLS